MLRAKYDDVVSLVFLFDGSLLEVRFQLFDDLLIRCGSLNVNSFCLIFSMKIIRDR